MLLNNRGFGQRVVAIASQDRPGASCPTTKRAGAGTGVGLRRRADRKGPRSTRDGNPVFYAVPKTSTAAQNDGQRWRWCLQQAVEFDAEPDQRDPHEVRRFPPAAVRRADDGRVRLAVRPRWRPTTARRTTKRHLRRCASLGEDETIARLATGIKRFKLPDEFNYIKIYQQVADEPQDGPSASDALEHLAPIFENRRQYPEGGRLLAAAA